MADVTTQNVNTQTVLPQWYQDYLQQIMGKAIGQVQAQPGDFNVAPVAARTADQNTAADYVRNNIGNGMSQMGQAQAGSLAAGSVNSAAAGANQFTGASDLFGQAGNTNLTGISQPGVNQGMDYLSQAAQGSSLAQANPYIQQSVSPMGLSAASPYLGAASQTFPGAAADYMSPYNSAVTDRIAQLGQRNLTENILPNISDTFVKSGQFGSPQMGTVTSRAIRDTNESILGQQAQALEQGYNTAGQQFQADASRQAQLAGTAGGLGTAQQQTLLGAGAQAGGLSSTDLSRLAAAGVNIGNLGLGQAGVAGQQGQLQLGAAQGLTGVGQAYTGAAAADASRNLAAQQQYANMQQQSQNMGYQQLGALDASGQSQQNQNQANMNSLTQNALYQQNYPWTQIQNASSVIQGLPNVSGTSGTTTTSTPSPSAASQIGGLGLGLAGLAQSGVFKAKGGAVKGKKYKRNASYGNVPRRGISLAEAA